MIRLLIVALLAVAAVPGPPAVLRDVQSSPDGTIHRLFAGMYAGDSTGMHALFTPDASLESVGPDSVSVIPVESWLSSLHGREEGFLDEQLAYTEVRQNGRLATAWTPYTFVLDGKVSHCGVNAWTLIQTGGAWRIKRVIDTRDYGSDCTTYDTPPLNAVAEMANRWHRAAARGDSATFFGLMTEDATYVGTDKTEDWSVEEFRTFAGPYFAQGSGWDFRRVAFTGRFDENHAGVAHWHETLDTWMGPCWGTGVAKRGPDGRWKVWHYTVNVAVDNDRMPDFLKLIGKSRE